MNYITAIEKLRFSNSICILLGGCSDDAPFPGFDFYSLKPLFLSKVK